MDRCRVRDIVFVRHVEGTEWHEVLVTAKAEDGSLCILTGGGDHYMLTAEDVGEVVVRKGTAVPAVIRTAGGLVVRLGLHYSPAQKEAIFKEAKGLVVEHEKAPGPTPPPRLGGGEPGKGMVPTGALIGDDAVDTCQGHLRGRRGIRTRRKRDEACDYLDSCGLKRYWKLRRCLQWAVQQRWSGTALERLIGHLAFWAL